MSISKLKMTAMMMATLLSTPFQNRSVGQVQDMVVQPWTTAPTNVRMRNGITGGPKKSKRRAKAKAARRARKAQR